MTLDQRIETKHRPYYGCHSDLDKLAKRTNPPPCEIKHDEPEKACDGCERKRKE